jgi:hypothetical protein
MKLSKADMEESVLERQRSFSLNISQRSLKSTKSETMCFTMRVGYSIEIRTIFGVRTGREHPTNLGISGGRFRHFIILDPLLVEIVKMSIATKEVLFNLL